MTTSSHNGNSRNALQSTPELVQSVRLPLQSDWLNSSRTGKATANIRLANGDCKSLR